MTNQKQIIAAYILIAVLTFGNAFNNIESTFKEPLKSMDLIIYFSFVESVFWPLYWSVQLWKL